MKRLGVFLLILSFMIVTGCASDSSSSSGQTRENSDGEAVNIVVGHTGTEGNSVYIFFEKLKEEIEEASDNNIKLDIQHSGALGGDDELVESVKIGSVDMISAASSNMAPYTEELLALDLPYIFKTREEANDILNGDIGQNLLTKVSQTTGNKALSFIDVGGFRLLANTKKEVKVPQDASGLKMRSTGSPIETSLIKGMGANPTPIAWGETYNSIEQKIVDGLQLQPNWLILNGFDEVVKYATETKGLMAFHVVQFNQDKWDSLTKEQQKVITEAVIKTRDYANKVDSENEEGFIDELSDMGVNIYTPSNSELDQWREFGEEIRNEQIKKNDIDQSLVDKILSAQE